MPSRICVIHFSLTGTVAMLAQEIANGAVEAGAEVRSRIISDRPQDGADDGQLASSPSLEDLSWADGLALGCPTRFGNVAAQFKQFLDSTGPLALQGGLADKAVTGFTSAGSQHGGQEATLLALYHTVFHWGAIIVPTGYTDPVLREIGGNPYGLSVTARRDASLTEAEIAAARFVGRRLAAMSDRLSAARTSPPALTAAR